MKLTKNISLQEVVPKATFDKHDARSVRFINAQLIVGAQWLIERDPGGGCTRLTIIMPFVTISYRCPATRAIGMGYPPNEAGTAIKTTEIVHDRDRFHRRLSPRCAPAFLAVIHHAAQRFPVRAFVL